MKQILYTAAHSGFEMDRVPLGGGATVCTRLVQEWEKTKPFPIRVLGPEMIGSAASRYQDLVHLSERRYARFCRDFEAAATQAVLQHDPTQTVVLSNDVAEGPQFRTLAERGYPLYTIYHVDVVDYFTRIYLKSILKTPTTTRLYTWVERWSGRWWIPDILKLVFDKQRDSVGYSKRLIVPSESMRDVLVRCYPAVPASKIHVLPWGIWEEAFDPASVDRDVRRLRSEYDVSGRAFVLLTLSRLSPEKGQDRLLKALQRWEKQPNFPPDGLWVFIAGEAAYMQGKRFEKYLRRLAAPLRKTRVVFPGYVTGIRKRAFFQLADLYVFPSRHESYGLTLLEAMRAGLPALACRSYGARDVLQPDRGILLPEAKESNIPIMIMESLRQLLADRTRLRAMGEAAKAYAQRQAFSKTAARLAELLGGEG